MVYSFNFCRGLDSYQDNDLNTLREKWNVVLDGRKNHLDKQMKELAEKESRWFLKSSNVTITHAQY